MVRVRVRVRVSLVFGRLRLRSLSQQLPHLGLVDIRARRAIAAVHLRGAQHRRRRARGLGVGDCLTELIEPRLHGRLVAALGQPDERGLAADVGPESLVAAALVRV